MTDGILKDSRRANERNDCTVRALSLAANIEYGFAWALLSASGRRSRCGMRNWSKAYKALGLLENVIKIDGAVSRYYEQELIGKGDRIVLIRGHIYSVRNGMTSDGFSENHIYTKRARKVIMAWSI